jgi:hypothetical protein
MQTREPARIRGRAPRFMAKSRFDTPRVSAFCPYDLHCERDDRVLRVEVKGTTSTGERVVLTRNEVAQAKAEYPNTALYVLADVTVVKGTDDRPSVRGRQDGRPGALDAS